MTRARSWTSSTATTRPLKPAPGVTAVGCTLITVTAGGGPVAAVAEVSVFCSQPESIIAAASASSNARQPGQIRKF